MKAIVVAIDKQNGIGANNDLLWQRDLPADLAHFRDLTIGTSIVMGRKTFEHIGRPLPKRENIVVSRSPVEADGVVWAKSIENAYELATHDIRIIGGGQLYEQTINDMDVLYVTEVDETFPQADVFFPEIDPVIWRETAREHHGADDSNKYAFDFVTYEKV